MSFDLPSGLGQPASSRTNSEGSGTSNSLRRETSLADSSVQARAVTLAPSLERSTSGPSAPASDALDTSSAPRRLDVPTRDSGLVRRDDVNVSAPADASLRVVLRELEARGDSGDDLRFQANLLRSMRDSVTVARQRTFVAAAGARVREEGARSATALRTNSERESFQNSMRVAGNTSSPRMIATSSGVQAASAPEPEPQPQQTYNDGGGDGGGGGGGGDGDPLMLDLNHDARLGVTGYSTAQGHGNNMEVRAAVDFDLDGNGTKERIEWMDGLGDGMLVDDRDGGVSGARNGEIDGTRLFGDEGGRFTNGYEKLSHLDADRNGKVEGAELTGLKVWVDDGDARVEAGELKTLLELGISSISVVMKLEENERGETLMRSSFTQNGVERLSEDVWFATDRTPRVPVDRLLEHIQQLIASDPPSNVLEAALRDMDKVLADVNKWSKHLSDLVEVHTRPSRGISDGRSTSNAEPSEGETAVPETSRRDSNRALRLGAPSSSEVAASRTTAPSSATPTDSNRERVANTRSEQMLRRT